MFSILAEYLREALWVVIIALGQRWFLPLGREFRPKVWFLDIVILVNGCLTTLILEEGFVQVWYQLTDSWIGSICKLLTLLRQRPAAKYELLALMDYLLGCMNGSHKLRGMMFNCLLFHRLHVPLLLAYFSQFAFHYWSLLMEIVSPMLPLLFHQRASFHPHFWGINCGD